jgi:hypothetical protein
MCTTNKWNSIKYSKLECSIVDVLNWIFYRHRPYKQILIYSFLVIYEINWQKKIKFGDQIYYLKNIED